MVFLNATQPIGQILIAMTNNITGSAFLTVLLIVIIFLAFFFMFRMPIEYSIILMLPMLIVIATYMSNFLIILGVLFIFLAIVVTRMFFI